MSDWWYNAALAFIGFLVGVFFPRTAILIAVLGIISKADTFTFGAVLGVALRDWIDNDKQCECVCTNSEGR